MDVGKMDRQVQLIRETHTTDSFGDVVIANNVIATIWSEVQDLRGREFFEAQQVNSEITTKFMINYRDGVDTAWAIRWKGKIYRIHQVIEIGRNEGLEIMASAGVNNG